MEGQYMKIGIIQQHNTADRTDNMQRLADGVRASAKGGAELVVLQELHNSLYFCQTENLQPRRTSTGAVDRVFRRAGQGTWRCNSRFAFRAPGRRALP